MYSGFLYLICALAVLSSVYSINNIFMKCGIKATTEIIIVLSFSMSYFLYFSNLSLNHSRY
jgi:hypothetical protein